MKCMLTTIDNEWNPYKDFTKWFLRDCELGYNSTILLNNTVELFCNIPYDEMTEPEQDSVREKAIDFIITKFPLPIYKKVTNST